MKAILIVSTLLIITGCSGSDDSLAKVITGLMTNCNKIGDTLTVTATARTWDRGIMAECVSIGDKPNDEE